MRIKGIKAVVVRKKGQVYRYYYHRKTNTRIKAVVGTAAFATEVDTLDEKAKRTTPRSGSLENLIIEYRRSNQFVVLAKVTKSDYQRVFNWLQPVADVAVDQVTARLVYGFRDKAYDQHKRRFANYVVQVLRLILEWGRKRQLVAQNVAKGIELIPRPKKMPRANRPWTDEERNTVLAEAPIELRAMIALGMFAGLREGDACNLPKTAYDGTDIETIASKNNEPIWLPAHFRLREILTDSQKMRKGRMARRASRKKVLPFDPPNLAISSRGTAWTESGFRASFFKLVKRLERDKKIKPGITFHGLRHTLGKLIIEAGGTREDVGIVLGDRSSVMAEFYSREFEKKARSKATMQRLEQTERAKLEK